MDVGQIAKEWYEKNEPEGALSATLLLCFFAGYIIKRPDFLLFGETCYWDGEKIVFVPRKHANGWFLYFWGSSKTISSYELCLEAPFALEWVVFKRRGRIRALSWEKLYAKDLGSCSRVYVPC